MTLPKKSNIFSAWFLACFFFSLGRTQAQFPMAWDAGIFGNKFDELVAAREFYDGGFVMGGVTYSDVGGDIHDTPRGKGDFFVVRTNDLGQPIWTHLYGSTETDRMTALDITADHGLVCVGRSLSDQGFEKSTPGFGKNDFWMIRLNDKGDLLWDKSFGGSGDDYPYSVAVHPSGDIYILGFSDSDPSGNKTAPHYGSNDYWLIKLDAAGNKIWDKSFGGTGDERLYYGALDIDADGNILLGGSSASDAGSMKASGNFGGMDFWVIKVDQDGQILWEQTFGGVEEDQVQDIIATQDGGYLVAGGTRSTAGGNKTSGFYGVIDYWLVKLDHDGNMLWEKTFGGSGLEVITGLAENSVGNILIGGLSDSPMDGTKTKASLGEYDYWLIFLDKDGQEIWQEVYGGSDKDAMTVLFKTSDGGYFVGGDSASGRGGKKTTDNYGFNDYWFFKLDCGWDYEPDYSFSGCNNQPIDLNLTTADCPGCTYVWPDGTQGDTYLYDASAPFGEKFEVTVSNRDGCPLQKPVAVHFLEPPVFSLGPDTTVYEQTAYVLRPIPSYPDVQYTWSTGDTSLTIAVTESGTYALEMGDADCFDRQEVHVEFKGNRQIFVPTAFSPNDDGFNDILRVYGDVAVENIKRFMIFDRVGSLVFAQANFLPGDNSAGWDGKYKGRFAATGVYVYFVEVEFTDGTTEIYKGDVSLIR